MFGDTPLVMVEDTRTLEEVARDLAGKPVIGLDTESDSFYAYQEKVCLIQISDLDRDYIIDPLRIDDMSPLIPILADPDVVKILHGADYDVVCLRRDFDYQIRGLFDTLVGAQLLGLPRIGLGDLLLRFFGVEVDKQYQRHNWAQRPLKREHLEYARGDTHWLLALREIFIHRLRAVDRMRHLEEECALLEDREWQGRPFDEDGYLRIKRANTLDDTGKRILKRLYLYRDAQAKRLDRPAFKVMPDDALVKVANTRPTTEAELDDAIPSKVAMKRRHGSALIRAVLEGLEDDFAVPRRPPARAKPERKGPRPRLRGRIAERALTELKEWRTVTLDREQITAYLVASNTTLKTIASQRPYTLEELADLPDVRQWQVEDFGQEILDVLDRVDPR